MGACWPGQLGHGAIGNWFAQRSAAQTVDLISSVLGRARTSVLNLAAVCYRTVQPRGRFNLLWFLKPAASVLNHSAICYPQDCSAQASLPCAVVAVSRFMGIMACSAGRRLAWQARAQSLVCTHFRGLLLFRPSRPREGILGPSAATQPDGWHSCLGRRAHSQVSAP
jgi:hypothetical protein